MSECGVQGKLVVRLDRCRQGGHDKGLKCILKSFHLGVTPTCLKNILWEQCRMMTWKRVSQMGQVTVRSTQVRNSEGLKQWSWGLSEQDGLDIYHRYRQTQWNGETRWRGEGRDKKESLVGHSKRLVAMEGNSFGISEWQVLTKPNPYHCLPLVITTKYNTYATIIETITPKSHLLTVGLITHFSKIY